MPRSLATVRHVQPRPSGAVSGPAGDLDRAFSDLYQIAQHSTHIFGSPLGPLSVGGESHTVPRFVYFGPQFSDESVRLVFHAGFDGRDARPSRALLHLVERLALKPDLGQGLNLTFFPLVNPSGLARSTLEAAGGQDLTRAHWNLSDSPEIALLSQDARLRAYHGFVRVESAAVTEIVATIRNGSRAGSGNDSVLAGPGDAAGFRVRWFVEKGGDHASSGPLTLADDLPLAPFELRVEVPDVWNDQLYSEAVLQVLKSFIIHYRATYAYGIHL
ncbi:MAG: hypothetical protein IAE82_08605 [Opitutaceae bacterium]|nr:hypothetical protein [Opitutaceae bacterium]